MNMEQKDIGEVVLGYILRFCVDKPTQDKVRNVMGVVTNMLRDEQEESANLRTAIIVDRYTAFKTAGMDDEAAHALVTTCIQLEIAKYNAMTASIQNSVRQAARNI